MDQEWHYGANKGTCMNRLENLFISFKINLKIFVFTNRLKQNSRTPQPPALIYVPAINYPVQYKQSHLHKVCLSILYQSTTKNRTILITN
jgi:hypothetical protein